MHPSQRSGFCLRRIFMVNLPRGREISGLHGARSLFQGAILRLVRLYGLSVEGLNMLSSMRLCANTPGQMAIQTALGGYQSENIRTQVVRPANSCFFTMVAVDDDHKPAAVPMLRPITPDEKRRHQAAILRKQLRQEQEARFAEIRQSAA